MNQQRDYNDILSWLWPFIYDMAFYKDLWMLCSVTPYEATLSIGSVDTDQFDIE